MNLFEHIDTLINFLLECRTNTTTVNQLIQAVETELAKWQPYDHTANTVTEACQVEKKTNNDIEDKGSSMLVSQQIEFIEKRYSKRELAYIVNNLLDQLHVLSEMIELLSTTNKMNKNE
jgi:hypothetical protein